MNRLFTDVFNAQLVQNLLSVKLFGGFFESIYLIYF